MATSTIPITTTGIHGFNRPDCAACTAAIIIKAVRIISLSLLTREQLHWIIEIVRP